MKNIIKYNLIVIFLGICTLVGCDEFLEEDLRSAVTPDNFFNNDAEAVLAVNGIYRYLHNNNLYRTRGIDNYYTSGADIQGPSRDVNAEIHNYLIAEGVSDGNGTWGTCYEMVLGTTAFLANIEGNESISEDTRNQAIGELLFLRALAYFHLTNLWGDVPYIREVLGPIEAAELGRESKDLIRTDMKQDLERAIALLPEVYGSSDFGRASKWAALALKAKFHLFDREWAECKTACDDIINNSQHTLLANYEDVFDPENEFNNEIIFEVDFVADIDNLSTQRTDDYNPRIRDEPSNQTADTIIDGVTVNRLDYFQNVVLAGLGEDMTGFGWAVPLPDFALRENWEAGDLRYDATIVSVYEGWRLSFPYFRKNWNLNQDTSLRQNHPENFIVFRLADIYLMAAEAENEINGPGGAYTYVNTVRERAFEPDQPWAGLDQISFREGIYDERKFELSAEGHRRMDLIRWGILLEVVQNTTHRSFNNPGANIQPHHVLLPIPQTQLELNPNLLNSDPSNNGYR